MYSITQNGKELNKSLYTIDKNTKTFSSNEDNLVLDFSDEYGWTFKTSFGCTFDTGSCCTFDTSYGCTFDTGSDCTFKTGSSCTFKTGSSCTFDTSYGCTFDTSYGCTFDTSYGCTFDTGSRCVVVRRDVYEVIELEEDRKVKLNEYGVKGFTYIEKQKEIIIDKEIIINGETYVLKTK